MIALPATIRSRIAATCFILAGGPSAAVTFVSQDLRCEPQSKAACQFVLYESRCQDGRDTSGRPRRVCTSTLLQDIVLEPGQVRRLDGLPADVRACAIPPGQRAKFPDCLP